MENVIPTVGPLPLSKSPEMDLVDKSATKEKSAILSSEIPSCDDIGIQPTLSPKVFIPDDNIINTRESVGVDLESQEDALVKVAMTELPMGEDTIQDLAIEAPRPEDASIKDARVVLSVDEVTNQNMTVEAPMPEDAAVRADVDVRTVGKDTNQDLNVGAPVSAITQVIQERRRSERLKETTALNTMEKIEKQGKKRNLEGNSSTSSKFSTLPVNDIIHTTSDMGIAIKHDDFATFDLLKS